MSAVTVLARRHPTAVQAGLAVVAAVGLSWSNAGTALADLSLPESLPVTCASGSVADASAPDTGAVADLSPTGAFSPVEDCSPVAEVSPVVVDDTGGSDDDGRCENAGADQREGWHGHHRGDGSDDDRSADGGNRGRG